MYPFHQRNQTVASAVRERHRDRVREKENTFYSHGKRTYKLVELGIVNPCVPLPLHLELSTYTAIKDNHNSCDQSDHIAHLCVCYENTVGVLMLTGYFVVWEKIGKSLNKV